MSGPVVISGILVQPLVREGRPGWRNGRRGALKMRCPRGHAGSSPAPGTSSTDTTAPAGFTAAGAVVEVRVSALGAGRDAVGLDACGLGAVEVTDPVHAQRVRRAVDRSEERRVGKECRRRLTGYAERKNAIRR